MINKTVLEYENPVQVSGSGNNLEQIEKLHELYEKGIIMKEEFEKKRQMLGL